MSRNVATAPRTLPSGPTSGTALPIISRVVPSASASVQLSPDTAIPLAARCSGSSSVAISTPPRRTRNGAPAGNAALARFVPIGLWYSA